MPAHEIDRLAAAINTLRPDWPRTSLKTFIRTRLNDRPLRDVTIALAWIAADPDTDTPARVLEAGPWWQAILITAAPDNGPRHWPNPAARCRVCKLDEIGHSRLNAAVPSPETHPWEPDTRDHKLPPDQAHAVVTELRDHAHQAKLADSSSPEPDRDPVASQPNEPQPDRTSS